MSLNQAQAAIKKIMPHWSINSDAKTISGTFTFRNYYQTSSFVNAVVWIAHQEDHHPSIEFTYRECHISYSTHAIDGLSDNDFICAAKIDQLRTAS